MNRRVRPPAAAGLFYPGDAEQLAAEVDALLADAGDRPGPRPRAVVAPHAGYAYSGPVAAVAYATVRPHAALLRGVAVAGPAHFVPLRGAAVPAAEAWATPLGRVAVDTCRTSRRG